MSRMKRIAVLACVAALISGCKTTVETAVSLSDLLTAPSKQLPGNLYVEVPSCQSHEDSRLPSTSVQDVQKAMPDIFSDAKYQECFRKGFDSYVRFSVPIFLDKDLDGKPASPSHINLISNEKALLRVSVPDQVKARIINAQKRSPVGGLDLKFVIRVKNDTGKDFAFTALAAYIDRTPHVFNSLTVKRGGEFVITLSDVSARSALDKGEALVLLLPSN